MKMYLPFGDWSGDGHREAEKILIEAPSMEHLLNAQIKIKEKYGKDFFDTFAQDWQHSAISSINIQALVDAGITLKDIFDDLPPDDDSTLEDWFEEENGYLEIDIIIDLFILLLNAYGAEIQICDKDIPMICNWTCPGFQTVGYGCYD